MMPRRDRSSKRSSKHRQAILEPDFSLVEGYIVNEKRHHRRSRKEDKPAKRNRASSVPSSKPSRKQRHDRRTHRIVLQTDTDGDFAMLPTPPASPEASHATHTTSNHDGTTLGFTSGRSRRHNPEHYLPPRSPEISTRDLTTSDRLIGDTTLKSFRFRHHILSLIDQQRNAVELWASSVGAGGPAEPMDWQPEQERVVYIARDSIEYGCYEDRWRVDGGPQEEKQQCRQGMQAMAVTTPFIELGSWTGDTPLDGSTMWGTPEFGLGFRDEIG